MKYSIILLTGTVIYCNDYCVSEDGVRYFKSESLQPNKGGEGFPLTGYVPLCQLQYIAINNLPDNDIG